LGGEGACKEGEEGEAGRGSAVVRRQVCVCVCFNRLEMLR
jgi:hypothetical protein